MHRLTLPAVALFLVLAEPVRAHMNEDCAEALTTYSLVVAAWALTTPPGKTWQLDDAPETVIAALRRVHRACVDRGNPKTRDGK